ncbi:MAG: hypothetical protein IJO11_03085 [Alphaproteobacteria bacterium]|nr:hypothetical protein [Alphaproteobacteria bacterium]
MKKNESGRSMVEMLGVLAIIGVLSVGGIAGYTMAMNRYRANEVVDMANKYAVIAYSAYMTSKMMNNGTAGNVIPTFSETGLFGSNTTVNGTTIGDAEIFADTGNGQDRVYIPLTFTDTKVCQAVATSLGAVAGTPANTVLTSTSSCDAKSIGAVFKQS